MADDIINSNEQQSQGAEPKETTAQKLNKYNEDYAKASAVLDTAQNAYESGKKNNDEFVNSGLNTTVAKDSNGNAIGTYDWEAQAEHTARITYDSAVLAAKQDATANKQELVANQQQGQTQHDMAGYAANQSAEKAGWTGGYILDSNRQVAFLKESIKANLYSQEELQKYGFDTALAAARAQYDEKKATLAMQNYNTAIQNAFQMAEFTGKFIAPETSYHLSQLTMAQKIIDGEIEGDKEKAEQVKSTVNSWFEGNNISKEGVYCMSILMKNYAQAGEVVNNIANAIDTLNAMLATNQKTVDAANKEASRTGIFSYVDEYGNIQKVSANWAVAMKGTMPDGFNNWSPTAQAEYKNTLGNVIAGDLKNRVESDSNISGKNFPDEASAKAAIHNAISDAIKNYENIDDVNIAEIYINVTIAGEPMSIPFTSSTVAGYKQDYGKYLDVNTNDNNTTTGADGKVYTTSERSEYSDAEYLKGLNNLNAGQNFHIKNNDGPNWDLEIWETIDDKTAINQGLKLNTITTTGIYHVNNTNGYIKDVVDKYSGKWQKEYSSDEYAALGTAYYVKVEGDKKTICVIGCQDPNFTGLDSNYVKFMESFK